MGKRIAIGLAALLVLPVVLWSVSKLLGPTAEERRALEALSQPWRPAGQNVFGDFWLSEYPVPRAQRTAVVDEDMRAFDGRAGNALVWGDGSVAAKRWPRDAPGDLDRERLCKPEEDCLTKVRNDLAAYRAMAERQETRWRRLADATSGDHLRQLLPYRIDAARLPPESLYAPATAHALAFVAGDRHDALNSVCERIADWRRLIPNTDSLMLTMLGVRYASRGYAQLAAGMLAEMRLDEPLPPACAVAFAPPEPAEINLCTAMRGEFRSASQRFASMAETMPDSPWRRIFHDRSRHPARLASLYPPACDPGNETLLFDDKPLPTPQPPGAMRLQCASDIVGCALASSIDLQPYSQYGDRLRDHAAMMRLLGGLVWMRDQRPMLADPATALAALPGQFRSPAHPLSHDEQRQSIVLPLVGRSADSEWLVPLPGSAAR